MGWGLRCGRIVRRLSLLWVEMDGWERGLLFGLVTYWSLAVLSRGGPFGSISSISIRS